METCQELHRAYIQPLVDNIANTTHSRMQWIPHKRGHPNHCSIIELHHKGKATTITGIWHTFEKLPSPGSHLHS
jgi:hypothetical protein